MLRRLALAAVMVTTIAVAARADVIVVVPGTADPWLAGMPNGSTASGGDVAPAQSPVGVVGLGFVGGSLLTFASTGSTDHCDLGGCGLAGAEGDSGEGIATHTAGAQNGLSNIDSPIDALLGVFLDASQPSFSAAPGALDFSSAASRDFASLTPALKQIFYIGNGLRNDGTTVQTFMAPAGATRLFLGTMDGFGWFNNVGSLTVTVATTTPTVPEPTLLGLLGLGLAGTASRVRRRSR